ncbi:membrane protein [Amycolatopsis ultiminotia]|uniref:Membrane protein n=1 Tax=Amycolatopsis ultiminotia TaxID=543629 RepID=A0ABP6XIY0_9PSEU
MTETPSVLPPPSRAAEPASPRRRRLGGRARKAWLVTHIVSSAAWIGIDVVLAVLVFTATLTDDRIVAATCYQALQLFAVWPLLITGLVCLASGIVLGLGSKYGVVRYWWVAVKLVLNIVLVVLGVLALRLVANEAVDYGRALAAGGPLPALPDLTVPPIVSPACLLAAVLLSVYKPWGRVKKA